MYKDNSRDNVGEIFKRFLGHAPHRKIGGMPKHGIDCRTPINAAISFFNNHPKEKVCHVTPVERIRYTDGRRDHTTLQMDVKPVLIITGGKKEALRLEQEDNNLKQTGEDLV